jgi:CHAD domain-containing protein
LRYRNVVDRRAASWLRRGRDAIQNRFNLSAILNDLRPQLLAAIVTCRANARPEDVHQLRTATRQIEAFLQSVAEDHRGAEDLLGVIKKTFRKLRRIRRFAGVVRDLDVHRKLVKKIANENWPHGSDTGVSKAEGDRRYVRRSIKQSRQKATKKLTKYLVHIEVGIERRLEEVSEGISRLVSTKADPFGTARKWAERAGPPHGRLKESNLHEFRKNTKAARYLAEMQTGQAAARYARQLHHIQDVIGYWHDCDLLFKEASAIVGKRSALLSAIKSERNRALKRAIMLHF